MSTPAVSSRTVESIKQRWDQNGGELQVQKLPTSTFNNTKYYSAIDTFVTSMQDE